MDFHKSSMALSVTCLAFLVVSVSGEPWLTWGNYHRVEVMFTRLENDGGIIANGKRCDVFTKCDPRIYAAIDIEKPYEGYPGGVSYPHGFTQILQAYDRNVVDMNNQIIKNICDRPVGTLPTRVTVRVHAVDYDYMTANDLMENFDCSFNFEPTPRDEMLWSPTTTCRPYHQYGRIRLMFKWRVVPIHMGECYSTGLLNLIARTTTTTTTTTTTPTTTTTTEPPTTTTTTETPTTTTEEPTTSTTEMTAEEPETPASSNTTEQTDYPSGNVTKVLVFEVPLTTEPAESNSVVYHDYEEGEVFTYSPYQPDIN